MTCPVVGIDLGDKAWPGIFEGIHLWQITVVDKEDADGRAHRDGKAQQNDEYQGAQISLKVPLHGAHYSVLPVRSEHLRLNPLAPGRSFRYRTLLDVSL